VVPWSGSHAGSSDQDWCTFTAAPSANDTLPVNCVTPATAETFCKTKRGGDLPTEAQFEYAAGGLRSGLYPWGEEDPVCGEAAFGLSGVGYLALEDGDCRAPTSSGGPLSPLRDRSDRDQVALPTGTLVDLAANVSEWVLDRWDTQDGPCWGTGVFQDPVCTSGSTKSVVSRGGNWADPPISLRAARRSRFDAIATDIQSSQFGFRCARRAT